MQDGADFYDDSRPLPEWEGAVRYYGALVKREGWQSLFPLFDLVKQIATSSASVAFVPSIIDDVLYIARQPVEALPAPVPVLSVEAVDGNAIRFKQYDAGSLDYRDMTCPRISAFAALCRIVPSL